MADLTYKFTGVNTAQLANEVRILRQRSLGRRSRRRCEKRGRRRSPVAHLQLWIASLSLSASVRSRVRPVRPPWLLRPAANDCFGFNGAMTRRHLKIESGL
jgi:hypothetical protein